MVFATTGVAHPVDPMETSQARLDEPDSTPQPQVRLIKAVISLHRSSTFDGDGLGDTPKRPNAEPTTEHRQRPVQLLSTPQRPTKMQHKQGSGDSPGFPTTATSKQKLESRRSIPVCESPLRPPRLNVAQRSSSTLRQDGASELGHGELVFGALGEAHRIPVFDPGGSGAYPECPHKGRVGVAAYQQAPL